MSNHLEARQVPNLPRAQCFSTGYGSPPPPLAHRSEPIDQVGDLPAGFVVLQLQEPADKAVAFRSRQKFRHEAVIGEPSRTQPGEPFEEELDADIQDPGDVKQAAGADAVYAFLVFLNCWKVSPKASASFSWLIPSMSRRALTRLPICLSTWLGDFFCNRRSCFALPFPI